MPKPSVLLLPAVALPAIALFFGWKAFWFLTDDAYIAFRYISNSVLGLGYVWNAAPFQPVEGYTSFGWVVLLEWVWRLFGVEPPRSANVVALVFTCATFGLTAYIAATMSFHDRLVRWRPLLVFLVLVGCVSNRTFLAWGSSGLETAFFNFCFLLWVFAVVVARGENGRRFFLVALSAALLYLARPDGLLFVAVAIVVLARLMTRVPVDSRWKPARLVALAPLLVVPVHLLWRKSMYGEWLPNTYVAKHTGPWPECGVRYLLSFVLEYAVWVWGVVLVLWVFSRLRKRVVAHPDLDRTLGVAAVLAHFSYYTFIIGGDHFEFRVYSQLIPLIMLSFVWLLNDMRWRAGRSAVFLASFLILSLPLPWLHWQKTRHLITREETVGLTVPLATSFPVPFRWYVGVFDKSQAWLIQHQACVRHQEHKVFHEFQVSRYPSRAVGETLGPESRPVYAAYTVGVPSWTLPYVDIIDRLGLNDYVIARNPSTTKRRYMAHSRKAPPGYVESFQPNVGFSPDPSRRPVALPRASPLEDRDIILLEKHWRQWVRSVNGG